MYSEVDLTWSSTEGYYKYDKVTWSMSKDGIPRFSLIDENGEKISIER